MNLSKHLYFLNRCCLTAKGVNLQAVKNCSASFTISISTDRLTSIFGLIIRLLRLICLASIYLRDVNATITRLSRHYFSETGK